MKTLQYCDGILKLLDQTALPSEIKYLDCSDYEQVAKAIKDMIVRGAPAIGVTAAYGIAIGASAIKALSPSLFYEELDRICSVIKSTRPTAVNLFWAADRMIRKARSMEGCTISDIQKALIEEAKAMELEDVETNRKIGINGSILLKDGDTVLTHCNAGALATCDYGTALGVIRGACEAGKKISVYADETRPYLQGARLTAWELMQDNIPVTLICDNMAGHFMKAGRINAVIVGADRIAANGDTANKIGTYSVSVLARENGIPFYVAAPISTIDPSIKTGSDIHIEERSSEEVTFIKGVPIAPKGVCVANPAFDVTPSRYITAIITEKGIIRPPYESGISRMFEAE